MRIRILLLLAFTISLLTLKAQDYKVLSVDPLPLDMTATTLSRMRGDGSAQCSALSPKTLRPNCAKASISNAIGAHTWWRTR